MADERFKTTRWSVVLTARDAEGQNEREALAWLCEAYWHPLYAYVRRRGHDAAEAADLTQAFFATLLEKKYLSSVRPELGKFRSFLLKAMQHFLSNVQDQQRALKRGGSVAVLSLDRDEAEEQYRIELRDDITPESIFEHRWAMTVLERALERARREAESRGRGREFERLSGFLTDVSPGSSYQEAAEALSTTVPAIKSAVYRLRQRFGKELRREVAETVDDPSGVNREVRHILDVLQG